MDTKINHLVWLYTKSLPGEVSGEVLSQIGKLAGFEFGNPLSLVEKDTICRWIDQHHSGSYAIACKQPRPEGWIVSVEELKNLIPF